MTTEWQKRKNKKKRPGKVVRFDKTAYSLLEKHRQSPKETASEIFLRVIDGLEENAKFGRVYYILPESKRVCDSLPEAKGLAILEAVRRGHKKPKESPIKVKEQL